MLPIYNSDLHVFNYDDIPPGYYYRAMVSGHSVQRFWHRHKFLEVASRIGDGTRVLDFGCGPGSFLSVLADLRGNVEGIGVDVAAAQVGFAREAIPEQDRDRITFLTVPPDSVRLPFEDGSFDVITCIEILEHIHPYFIYKIMEEFRRCLKDDGRIIVTTPNYRSLWPLIEVALNRVGAVSYHEQHISKYTPNAFVKILECVGYRILRLDSIFLLAPFFAVLSERVAGFVHRVEKKVPLRLGSLLIAEVEKLRF